MIHAPRSPALAVAVLFGLFAMVMFMDPAHFPQDPKSPPSAPAQVRAGG